MPLSHGTRCSPYFSAAHVSQKRLAAADKMQQTGSYVTAEQAATSNFGTNLRLYAAPSCSGYGTPGASPWTVTSRKLQVWAQRSPCAIKSASGEALTGGQV